MRVSLAGVEITSDRTYRFDLSRPALWQRLTRADDYTSWWPWVRDCQVTELAVGEVWRFAIQPPLPYALRCAIDLRAVVEPELIEAEVTGDLRGWARVMMRDLPRSSATTDGEAPSETEVRVVTELAAVSAPVRLASRAFPTLARWGHDWVLDTAARQFAAATAAAPVAPERA
jgi:uncharacterized protein YndB with AHSA1/START domain